MKRSLLVVIMTFLGIICCSPRCVSADDLLHCLSYGDLHNSCNNDDKCHYCPVEGVLGCKPVSEECKTCADYDMVSCSQEANPEYCYWCNNKQSCLDVGVSCTCGDGYLQAEEDCDTSFGDPNCVDCVCVNDSIPYRDQGSCCEGCVVDNACWNDGEANPSNCRQLCDPSSSRTSWTARAGCPGISSQLQLLLEGGGQTP